MTLKQLLITLFVILVTGAGGFFAYTRYNASKTNIIESPATADTSPEQQASSEKTSQIVATQLSGCKAAFTPEAYQVNLKISDEAKVLLRQYRQKWQDVCIGKSEQSLYPLWVAARELISAWREPETEYADLEPLLSFVPGIRFSTAEGTVLSLQSDIRSFNENINLGNAEDKNFFAFYSSLFNDYGDSLWFEQNWDYGGCIKFGDYDWVKTLKGIDTLAPKVMNPLYLEELVGFKNGILSHFAADHYDYFSEEGGYSPFYTCHKKEAVLIDFEKVLQYVKGNPSYRDKYSPTISNIEKNLSKLKSGEIKVISAYNE